MSDFVKSLAQSAAQINKVASGSLYPHQSDGVAFLLSRLPSSQQARCLRLFRSLPRHD